MRSPHHLHGVFDMTPFPGFFQIAFALASNRVLGGFGNGNQAMLFKHLSRDRVNLQLGYHPVLLKISEMLRR
jgi:hypothetical protein